MGFFDSLLNSVSEKVGKAEKMQDKQRSALAPGRMQEADSVKGNSLIPKSPGIYQHVNKQTGKVEYAGQTNDLRKRQQEHARAGKLDTEKQKVRYGVARDGANKNDLLKTEVDHIARHKPVGNTTKGGNGRR